MKNIKVIHIVLVVLAFTSFVSFPKEAQVITPLIISIYYGYKTIQSIYQKKYWDEIMRFAIYCILGISGFITYYTASLSSNYNFEKIALLIFGWLMPLFSYTLLVTWKRKGDTEKYKLSMLLFYYSIALCIFCTLIVLLN